MPLLGLFLGAPLLVGFFSYYLKWSLLVALCTV